MKFYPYLIKAILAFTVFSILGGSLGYSSSLEMRESPKEILYGTVIVSTRYLTNGQKTALGRDLGAIVGMATQIDREGSYTSIAAGAVVGSVVGQEVEKLITSERKEDVYISLSNGKEIMVTRWARGRRFRSDQKVKILIYKNGRKEVYGVSEYVEMETNPYDVSQADFDSRKSQ